MKKIFSNLRLNFALVVVLICGQIQLNHDNASIYIIWFFLFAAVSQAYFFIDNLLRELKSEVGKGSSSTVGVDGRMIPSEQK